MKELRLLTLGMNGFSVTEQEKRMLNAVTGGGGDSGEVPADAAAELVKKPDPATDLAKKIEEALVKPEHEHAKALTSVLEESLTNDGKIVEEEAVRFLDQTDTSLKAVGAPTEIPDGLTTEKGIMDIAVVSKLVDLPTWNAAVKKGQENSAKEYESGNWRENYSKLPQMKRKAIEEKLEKNPQEFVKDIQDTKEHIAELQNELATIRQQPKKYRNQARIKEIQADFRKIMPEYNMKMQAFRTEMGQSYESWIAGETQESIVANGEKARNQARKFAKAQADYDLGQENAGRVMKNFNRNRGMANAMGHKQAAIDAALAANDADMAQGGVSSRFTSPDQARQIAGLERKGGKVMRGGRYTVGKAAERTFEKDMYADAGEGFGKRYAQDRMASKQADQDQEDLKRFYLREKGDLKKRYADVWENPKFKAAFENAEANVRRQYGMRSTDTRGFREEMLKQINDLDSIAAQVRKTEQFTKNQAEIVKNKASASETVLPAKDYFKPGEKVRIEIDARSPGAEGVAHSVAYSPNEPESMNRETRIALNNFGIHITPNLIQEEEMSPGKNLVKSVDVSFHKPALRLKVGDKLINTGTTGPEGQKLKNPQTSRDVVYFSHDADVGSIEIKGKTKDWYDVLGKDAAAKFDNLADMRVDGSFVSDDGQFKVTRYDGKQFIVESCAKDPYTVFLKNAVGAEVARQRVNPMKPEKVEQREPGAPLKLDAKAYKWNKGPLTSPIIASPNPDQWMTPHSVPLTCNGRETVVVNGERLFVYRKQSEQKNEPTPITYGYVRTLFKNPDTSLPFEKRGPVRVFVVGDTPPEQTK